MSNLLPDFDWYRCPQGYRIARAGEIESGVSNPDDLWIVPKSKERVSYRPLEKYDLLYVAFANVKTPDELFEFVKLYGPLTTRIPEWGDSISELIKVAQLFRNLMHRKALGPKALMSFWVARENAVRRAADLPQEDDLRRLDRFIATVHIVPDPKKGIRLRIETEALIAALWWQLAQKLSGDAIIRECRHCGTLFEAGPGTNRRADATFCSSEHSVRFHSLKRTGGI